MDEADLGPAGAGAHRLVQAPVAPIDVDGVGLVSVGTALFGLAAVVLALLRPQLAAAGYGWWLGIALSGFGLGLLGLVYCTRRRRQRQAG